MEMTGLNPDADRIIELAIVVTNANLDIMGESTVWAIHQPESVLSGMDEWNQKTHARSGLVKRVRASVYDERQAEVCALEFVQQFVPRAASPMCGNSICQDRRFMARYMPTLEAWFHYRNLDVSTLKELSKRWAPVIYKGFRKRGAHEALADIHESIEELKYYREHFIRL